MMPVRGVKRLCTPASRCANCVDVATLATHMIVPLQGWGTAMNAPAEGVVLGRQLSEGSDWTPAEPHSARAPCKRVDITPY